MGYLLHVIFATLIRTNNDETVIQSYMKKYFSFIEKRILVHFSVIYKLAEL